MQLKIKRGEKLQIGLIVLVLVLLKIPLPAQGFFAFAYDQGRDFLAVSIIVFEKHFTLIGPTTGLPGIFYGPWWYYFLSPLMFIFRGNPLWVEIVFAFLGIATVLATYLLIRHLTKNIFLTFSLTLIAAISSSWMLSPTLIWSPSLAPLLMLALIYLVSKIFENQKPVYFFLLGAITLLIADSGAAFGIMMTIFLFIMPIIFRREFFRKEFFFTVLGAFLIYLPRLAFDLRHNFLISRSIIAYLLKPKVFGDYLPFQERFLQRIDLYWVIFSGAFARSNKAIGLVLVIIIIASLLMLLRRKTTANMIMNNYLVRYLTALLITLLLLFSVFKDIVWDYYLIGLPIIFIVLIALLLNVAMSQKKLALPIKVFLLILVLVNFNPQLFSPFSLNWQGDSSVYRNQKNVMDYLADLKPQNYSIYAYSPAILDYPFDYLIYWYQKRGLIRKPTNNQNLLFLIIRDDDKHTYLSSGWYGDKTKDRTTLLERREFPGQLILEKHSKND